MQTLKLNIQSCSTLWSIFSLPNGENDVRMSSDDPPYICYTRLHPVILDRGVHVNQAVTSVLPNPLIA